MGQMAKPGTVTARMQALIRCAGPEVTVVAACARTRITPAGAKVLQEHHVALITVDGSKDAADEALLAEAQRRADGGCRRFVVASNDSTFARVADLGDLEIVIWAPQKPRKNYTARASRTHRLPIPAASATSHSTTPAKAPAASPAKSSTATKTYPPVTPKNTATISANAAKPATASRQRHPHPPPSETPAVAPPRMRPLAAGVSFLAAGLLFGAGAAVGDLAVRRLLRCLNRD